MKEGNVSVEFPFEGNGKVNIIVGSHRKKYIIGTGSSLLTALNDADATQKLIAEKGFFMRKPVVG